MKPMSLKARSAGFLRRIFALSMLLGVCAPLGAAAPDSEAPRNVILIGWDGAQRNHVKECLGRGELPNLKRLADEGTIVAIDVLRVTDTKSGWAQILTGYEPEITGVFSNRLYQPIPKGYTIFERIEKALGSDFFTAAVIGKKAHVDADPPSQVLAEETSAPQAERMAKAERRQLRQARRRAKAGAAKGAGKVAKKPGKAARKAGKAVRAADTTVTAEKGGKQQIVPGKPYYLAKDGMDLFVNALNTNENVASETLALLDQHKSRRFFLFVHFAEVDHSGHRFGENSKEYNDALISSDLYTGKIMEKLKQLGLYDRTLIYVTADHGFNEGAKGHPDAPYVFLATNDKKVMRRGVRADITPTILDRLGVDLSKIEPPLDGHPLTRPFTPPVW